MPQPRVETTDPSRLHLSGEFVESNLGSVLEANGMVTVRAIGQQYSFTPACIVVPADTPITLRATSADVVHGILIQGTNVNTMLVPGYISEQLMRFDKTGDYLMPCQEFCSFGHEGMWGKVKVIDKADFARSRADRREAELCWSNRKLILAHFWLAFAVFGVALLLGAWQMFVRSPLGTWISNPEWYYRSLTAHGTVMGYVFPTLVAMGFGYAISEVRAGAARWSACAGPGPGSG